ncbi:uncharacterized protein LOC129576466 [Sitodiplosis mosellana]|uniref:uncharacterized protein LOC129576466 n=1 Tax=Sitodiplosis mosellana TaxID=263140 RepID=UPI002444029F|nr:uncharacterized protein LOC129576466 [Sitodiplosis mosellana]
MKGIAIKKPYWTRGVSGMACVESVIFLIVMTFLITSSEAVNVALSYAYEPNVTALSKFDWAVVDGDANFEPPKGGNSANRTVWLSYVSVGEVQSHRPFFKQMPRSWLIGKNDAWESYVINQTAPGWTSFFVEKVATPFWNRGFKGFFLDTLDSYQIVAKTEAQRQAQENGLAQTILALKHQFPNAILIMNRGFEIMSRVHQAANMVAFESLYAGWNQAKQKYMPVSENDRNWLLAQVQGIKTQYNLPILAIDYCPPKNMTCVRTTVNRIIQQGIVPYVTDPQLQTVGYGPQNLNQTH